MATVAMASVCVLVGALFGLSQSGLIAQWAGARLSATALPMARPASAGRTPPDGSEAGPGREATPARPPKLTAAERRACPPSASACADVAAHVAWLQSGGRVTYGPVRAEPGQPGSPEATPRGTFHVQWKAGPHYVSDEYRDPMPWATFFASGGIAFHGGSLTKASHGCVHLTIADARYFQAHLPLGAEVVIF